MNEISLSDANRILELEFAPWVQELGLKIKELGKMIQNLQALEAALNGKISAQTQRLDKLTTEIEDLDLKIGQAQASGKQKLVKQLLDAGQLARPLCQCRPVTEVVGRVVAYLLEPHET